MEGSGIEVVLWQAWRAIVGRLGLLVPILLGVVLAFALVFLQPWATGTLVGDALMARVVSCWEGDGCLVLVWAMGGRRLVWDW